jgi:hypothetical protein
MRKRVGRVLLLLLWLGILLIPGFFILMVVNNEFSISLGDAPGQNLRVWLVSEIRERGFGVATGSVSTLDETNVCVQTDLRYLLWQGTQAPSTFCECYTRPDNTAEWSYATGWEGTCAERRQETAS